MTSPGLASRAIRPRPRSRRSTPRLGGAANVRRDDGGLLGRAPERPTVSGRSGTASTSSSGPATSTTCAWLRARTASTRRSASRSASIFPFLDTDVYKWLEAVGWELGRGPDAALAACRRRGDRRSSLPPSGPTATSTRYVQVVARRPRVPGPRSGATSSTASGHLIQAAVAWHRALGDDRLLDDRGPRRRLGRARAWSGRPRRHRRPPRDRDGARRAVPDDR